MALKESEEGDRSPAEEALGRPLQVKLVPEDLLRLTEHITAALRTSLNAAVLTALEQQAGKIEDLGVLCQQLHEVVREKTSTPVEPVTQHAGKRVPPFQFRPPGKAPVPVDPKQAARLETPPGPVGLAAHLGIPECESPSSSQDRGQWWRNLVRGTMDCQSGLQGIEEAVSKELLAGLSTPRSMSQSMTQSTADRKSVNDTLDWLSPMTPRVTTPSTPPEASEGRAHTTGHAQGGLRARGWLMRKVPLVGKRDSSSERYQDEKSASPCSPSKSSMASLPQGLPPTLLGPDEDTPATGIPLAAVVECEASSSISACANQSEDGGKPATGNQSNNSSLRKASECGSARQLRMEREEELLSYLTNLELPGKPDHADGQECRKSSPFIWNPPLLRLAAVLPWECPAMRFYRPAVLALVLCVAGLFLERFAHAQWAALRSEEECGNGRCLQLQHLCDFLLSMGCFVGLVAMRKMGNGLMGGDCSSMVIYARRQNCVDKWSLVAVRQAMVLFVLWAAAVACRLGAATRWADGGMELIYSASFVLVSIVFASICLGILHVSCGTACLVDSYCLHLSIYPDVSTCVREWNMMQAFLRRVSRSLESAFMVIQTTALAMVFFAVGSVLVHGALESWWPLSHTLLALSLGLNFFKAAEVTEKCSRMPALVNSLTFSDDVDYERQYLVEYVSNSMAGFYLGDIRLTAAMALKFTYLCALASFGVLTKITTFL